MRLVLQQSFPLGRFHATPWRVNPFDDPYGEWPPSPWRLVRAIVARWYQWRRETVETWPEEELDDLIRALCASVYSSICLSTRGTPSFSTNTSRSTSVGIPRQRRSPEPNPTAPASSRTTPGACRRTPTYYGSLRATPGRRSRENSRSVPGAHCVFRTR